MSLVTAAAFSARYSAGKTHNRLRLHDGNNNNAQHKNLSLASGSPASCGWRQAADARV